MNTCDKVALYLSRLIDDTINVKDLVDNVLKNSDGGDYKKRGQPKVRVLSEEEKKDLQNINEAICSRVETLHDKLESMPNSDRNSAEIIVGEIMVLCLMTGQRTYYAPSIMKEWEEKKSQTETGRAQRGKPKEIIRNALRDLDYEVRPRDPKINSQRVARKIEKVVRAGLEGAGIRNPDDPMKVDSIRSSIDEIWNQPPDD